MSTSPQVPPHEADTGGRFTPANAAEMGSRGAARREQNWQEKVTLHREELEKHAEAAVQSLGEILAGDGRDSDKLKAAQIVLDRIGIGPHSSQDVNVETKSLVEKWAEELEELEALGLTPELGDGAKPEAPLVVDSPWETRRIQRNARAPRTYPHQRILIRPTPNANDLPRT